MTVHNDTVEQATQDADLEQPYRELGLKDDEYARIRGSWAAALPTPS